MLERLRSRRPGHATVVAYLALFVALGGTGAYAANTVFSTDIVDGEVKNPDVGADAITAAKVANLSLTGQDLRGESVGGRVVTRLNGSDIDDNTLGGADILESSLAKVPNADKLDGLDSLSLVKGGDFGSGKASADRAGIARDIFGIHLALEVQDFGDVVGQCDDRGIRIGFLNRSGGFLDVFVDDAGSPPAYDSIGVDEVIWAPFHPTGRAITTFQAGRNIVGGLRGGYGERVATIWASARIPVGDPQPDYCIVQAQALAQVDGG